MDKSGLIKEVSLAAGVSRAVARKVIEAFCDTVPKTVKSGEEVKIHGFGKFEQVKRSAKRVRNPKTGEMMQIPAGVAPKFRAGRDFNYR